MPWKRGEPCCGSCRYHFHDSEEGEWVCDCPGSEEYTDYTDYSHRCEDWEGRGQDGDQAHC